jgi:hypothetical protein
MSIVWRRRDTLDRFAACAGVRFNFPGLAPCRPISWDEWLANFDPHQCAFVSENELSTRPNNRYRIVKADEWKNLIS